MAVGVCLPKIGVVLVGARDFNPRILTLSPSLTLTPGQIRHCIKRVNVWVGIHGHRNCIYDSKIYDSVVDILVN